MNLNRAVCLVTILAVVSWGGRTAQAEPQTKTPGSRISKRTGQYDAVVVGAGLGGLITGAILSKNGLKTLIVDQSDQIGGRMGAVNYNGYWLDWGPRDARDFGDNFIMTTRRAEYGKKAAEAAGAKIAWVGPIPTNVLVHRMADGKLITWSQGPDAFSRFGTEALDLSSDQANKFAALMGKLATEDPKKTLNITMGQYLSTVDDPAMHEALLRISMLFFAEPLEETSVGRWAESLQNPLESYKFDDPEVGNQQGLMEPYARVIRKHGGEIKLGLQTMEITTDADKITGIIVRDKINTVQEFRAPVVVFNDPIWNVFEVLNESHFPQDVVKNARELQTCFKGDMMVLNMGVSRVPTIRATGKPDAYIGYNQFLEDESGWYIPSLSSKKAAPPGKHLLSLCAAGRGLWSYKEGQDKLNTVREYMRRYYSDLDQITEWTTTQWQRTWGTSHCWSTTPQSPLQVPGVDGLYFVGNTVEVDGLYEDIDANSALQATQMILSRQGK